MSTLVEREMIVARQAADLDQLGTRLANLDILRTRSKQLDDRTREISKTADGIILLQKHQLKVDNLPNPSKELRSKLAKLKTDVASDWVAVVRNEEIATTFPNPIEAYTKRLSDSALTVWRQHIDDAAPKINDALLATLKSVFGPKIARLQVLRQDLVVLRSTLPSDEEAFTKLKRIVDEIKNIWEELEGIPGSVRAFLAKAAQRQATIAELTPEVKNWLEKNSILAQLRIGFA